MEGYQLDDSCGDLEITRITIRSTPIALKPWELGLIGTAVGIVSPLALIVAGILAGIAGLPEHWWLEIETSNLRIFFCAEIWSGSVITFTRHNTRNEVTAQGRAAVGNALVSDEVKEIYTFKPRGLLTVRELREFIRKYDYHYNLITNNCQHFALAIYRKACLVGPIIQSLGILVIQNNLLLLARDRNKLCLEQYDASMVVHQRLPSLLGFQEEEGWGRHEYFSTFRSVSVNDKLYLLARGAQEVHLAEYDSRQNMWRWQAPFSVFRDQDGWKRPEYYSTLQCVTLNDKIYLVARGSQEVHLAEYDPQQNIWRWRAFLPAFQDKESWNRPEYYLTFQCTALNNQLYLIARGVDTLYLARYNPLENAWQWLSSFTGFQDKLGWNRHPYYSTLRCVTLNDKIYLVARGSQEVHLAEYDPQQNVWRWRTFLSAFQDKEGWSRPEYYSTFQCAALNNCLYLIARGVDTLYLARYNPLENAWRSLSSFTGFPDRAGWNQPEHYYTLKLVPSADGLLLMGRQGNALTVAKYSPAKNIWVTNHEVEEASKNPNVKLNRAISQGCDITLCNTLFPQGADLNNQVSLFEEEGKEHEHRTPLMRAICSCNYDLVDWLLKHNMNMGLQDSEGWTSMHHAIATSQHSPALFFLKILWPLYQHEVDMTARTNAGEDMEAFANKYGSLEAKKLVQFSIRKNLIENAIKALKAYHDNPFMPLEVLFENYTDYPKVQLNTALLSNDDLPYLVIAFQSEQEAMKWCKILSQHIGVQEVKLCTQGEEKFCVSFREVRLDPIFSVTKIIQEYEKQILERRKRSERENEMRPFLDELERGRRPLPEPPLFPPGLPLPRPTPWPQPDPAPPWGSFRVTSANIESTLPSRTRPSSVFAVPVRPDNELGAHEPRVDRQLTSYEEAKRVAETNRRRDRCSTRPF